MSTVRTPACVDLDREPVHRAVRRPELRPFGLDAEPVIARLVARAVEPEVLDARVRSAAEVRTDLRDGTDVQRRALAGRVGPRSPCTAGRIDRHDEGPRVRHVRGEAVGDGQPGICRDQVLQRSDPNLRSGRRDGAPPEADRPAGELGNPDPEGGTDRAPQELTTRQAATAGREDRAAYGSGRWPFNDLGGFEGVHEPSRPRRCRGDGSPEAKRTGHDAVSSSRFRAVRTKPWRLSSWAWSVVAPRPVSR